MEKCKKNLIFIGLLLICLLSTGCSGDKQDERLEEAFEAYVQAIKDYVTDSENFVAEQIKYSLAYINDDDIPELILSTGISHAAGVRIYFYDFDQKKVVDTGERYGENGDFESFYERKSTIFDWYFGNGGYGNFSFCEIGADYKLAKRSRFFTTYSDTDGNPHYYIDFKEVSEEEYEKIYKEEAPSFADQQEKLSIYREDMPGDYQTCCSEDAVKLFFKMVKSDN